MLGGIQCGRAVAAIMVAVFHANSFFLPDKLYGGRDAGAGWSMGYAGVEFFFVLSGFIMLYVHARDFGVPARAQRFMRKRIVRIYPFYWCVMALLLLSYAALPGTGPEAARDPLTVLGSLLLWPGTVPQVMNVAWTLQHEMLFYLVFVTMILSARAGVALFGGWMLACLVAVPFGIEALPLAFLLSPYNLLFLFGMVAAHATGRLSVPVARALFAAGAVLFFGVGLIEQWTELAWHRGARTLLYGIGAALMVAGLASGRPPAPRWLSFLGDASYAIYLVHVPVMSAATLVVAKLGLQEGVPPALMLALLVATGVTAGAVAHVLVERPLLRAFAGRPPPATQPSA